MHKTMILLLLMFVVGCGIQEPEDMYPPEDPTCWTVDGDPELYFYVLPSHTVDEEFYANCQKMREERVDP